jgi:exodeoxyribonuclease V beta subunit
VTIHSSKGLEYPVVFCPFVWEARGYTKGSTVFCHAPAKGGRKTRSLMDLGSPQWEQHEDRARWERISENIRLLYVALTRARQRCYLVWGKVNRMHNAALPWLFYADFDGSNDYVKNLEYDEIVGPVRELAIHSSGGITWSNVEEQQTPAAGHLRATTSSTDLRARRYAGKPPSPGWGVASYTSLTKNWSRSSHDRDSAAEPAPVPQERDNSIFCFPLVRARGSSGTIFSKALTSRQAVPRSARSPVGSRERRVLRRNSPPRSKG